MQFLIFFNHSECGYALPLSTKLLCAVHSSTMLLINYFRSRFEKALKKIFREIQISRFFYYDHATIHYKRHVLCKE